jgi:hypothetical protein
MFLKNKTGGQIIKKADYDKDILEKLTIKLITSIEGEQAEKLIKELDHGMKLCYFIEKVYGRTVLNFHLKE